MVDPHNLLETDNEPYAPKVSVWSDAQWSEALADILPGSLVLPAFMLNPYDPKYDSVFSTTSVVSTDGLRNHNKMAALVLADYAKALIEISRIADSLAKMCQFNDTGFDKIQKTSEAKLKKFQCIATCE